MRTAGQLVGSSQSTKVMVTFVSQVSLAVGLPNTGADPVTHALVRSGLDAITGGVVSTIVMGRLLGALFVRSSVAVQVRRKMRTAGQLAGSSVSTKVMVTFVSQELGTAALRDTGNDPVAHSLVRSDWHAITGGVVSTNVNAGLQLALLVQSAVA